MSVTTLLRSWVLPILTRSRIPAGLSSDKIDALVTAQLQDDAGAL